MPDSARQEGSATTYGLINTPISAIARGSSELAQSSPPRRLFLS
jgi:hypothetical protein